MSSAPPARVRFDSLAGLPALAAVLGFCGFAGPDYVLSSKARKRREDIRSQLPDALDLLMVSVEAGLGFDGAISKLIEHMERPLIRTATWAIIIH